MNVCEHQINVLLCEKPLDPIVAVQRSGEVSRVIS